MIMEAAETANTFCFLEHHKPAFLSTSKCHFFSATIVAYKVGLTASFIFEQLEFAGTVLSIGAL